MTKMQKVWAQLDSLEQQILVLAALIPPPVPLDYLLAGEPNQAVAVLGALEGLQKANLLAVYEPAGTGHYFFPLPKIAKEVLVVAGEGQTGAAADKLSSFYQKHLPQGPRLWCALTNIQHMTGLTLGGFDAALAAAHYCLGIKEWEAAGCYFDLVLEQLPSAKRSKKQKIAFVDACLGKVASRGHLTPLVRQKESLREARALARQLKDASRQVKVDIFYARIANSEGDYATASRVFEEGWKMAQQVGDVTLLKWAALATTDFLFWQGRVAEAVGRYEEAVGQLEDFSSSDGAILRACANLGWAYSVHGQTARGLGLIEAIRNEANKRGLQRVANHANMMSVLASLEAKLIDEAERFLRRLRQRPEEELGHRFMWAADAADAFLHYCRGDLEGCFRLQSRAWEHSHQLGWSHHKGPWNFEYLDALEKHGLVHPEMSYDSEVERVLSWPDIYMQGVGLRYRALRLLDRKNDAATARRDLERSQELLERSGAGLELARTRISLGRMHLVAGENDQAHELLRLAWKTLAPVNQTEFPQDLLAIAAKEDRERIIVRTLVEAGNTLGTLREPRKLLDQLINLALRLSQAQRGAFFEITSQGDMELIASRNIDRATVESKDFAGVRELIMAGLETGRTRILVPGHAGAGEAGAGWMIFAPLLLGDQVLGVLYLDSSLKETGLDRRDLPLLSALSTQMAVALDNAKAYQEIANLRDRLERETKFFREEWEGSPYFDHMVGHTPAMRRVFKRIEKVAQTDTTVLIPGETGVGKELVARSIHRRSPRSDGPFIPVNAASLPDSLVASELFGHEKGAFTGALRARPGRFELAEGGTLFLDDVDTVPLSIQVQLLRVLQEKEFTRLGDGRALPADFRLITASSQDLEAMVRRGDFRPDFFYRLKVFPIEVPPLRERKEDIPLLVNHFLKRFNAKLGKAVEGVPEASMQRFLAYPWPGNVRELIHVVERGVILSEGKALVIPELPGSQAVGSASILPWKEMERQHIIQALEWCNWKVSGPGGAAELLELHPSTLKSKMGRLDIRKQTEYVVGRTE